MRQPIAVHFLLIIIAVVFVAVSNAANSCFKTDDYNAIRGQPFIITWPEDDSEHDLSLLTPAGQNLGYIARNLTATQTSLAWTPPLNITDGPFRFELYMYIRGSTCLSPNFTIQGDANAQVQSLDAPSIATVVTINNARTTVIATVATPTPLAQVPSTSTTSATPVPSQVSKSSSTSTSDNNKKLEIGIGVAMGALVLIVLVLGALLWRSRRKRRRERDLLAQGNNSDLLNDKKTAAARHSNTSTPINELDSDERNELESRERLELDSRGKPQGFRPGTTYAELEDQGRRAELGTGFEKVDEGRMEPVELPGEVPVSWLRARPDSMASITSGDEKGRRPIKRRESL